MSESSSTNNDSASNQPSHAAVQVRDHDGGKGFWTRIGAAWAHADGKGLNIQIDVVPLDGRIMLRLPSDEKKTATPGDGREA